VCSACAGLIIILLVCGQVVLFGELVAIAAVAGGVTVLYSRIKASGAPATATIALVWPLAALAGWLVSGSGARSIGVIAVYAYGVGISDSLVGALRDVDNDPRAGMLTLPVRIGAIPTFHIAALADAACYLILIGLWAFGPRVWTSVGVAIAGIAAVMMAIRYRPLLRSLATGAASDRSAQLRLWTRAVGVRELGLLTVCSPAVGLPLGLLLTVVQVSSSLAASRWARLLSQHQPSGRITQRAI
jgi:hypothetical protein